MGVRGVGIAVMFCFRQVVRIADPPHSGWIVQLLGEAREQTLPTNLGIWKLELWQIVCGQQDFSSGLRFWNCVLICVRKTIK